jgi:glycosyltransferase involved in cell wall biosynthesis
VIDVIIPVYKGARETRRCIESVLGSRQRAPFAIVVVDDASPDPQIVGYLDELEAGGQIAL